MTAPTLTQLIVHAEISISPIPRTLQSTDPYKLDYFGRICQRALELQQSGATLEELESSSNFHIGEAIQRTKEVCERLGHTHKGERLASARVKLSKAENTAKLLALLGQKQ